MMQFDINTTLIVLKYSLQILLLALALYKIYGVIAQSRAIPALRSIMIMGIIISIIYLLKLEMLMWLIDKVSLFLFLAVAVAFQQEIRKMFTIAGNSLWFSNQTKASKDSIESILSVLESLAQAGRGALITLVKKISLKPFIDSGVPLDAIVSSALLNTIFRHDTPLHDGAVIIHNNRIVAAGCFLPMTKQEGLEKTFGSRHRAALGIAEETDAITIIVSEETGSISLTYDGVLYYNQGVDGVRRLLKKFMDTSQETSPMNESVG
ncbi:MAG: diadenylate cyclase CdaA [Spirochaetia bacterium]